MPKHQVDTLATQKSKLFWALALMAPLNFMALGCTVAKNSINEMKLECGADSALGGHGTSVVKLTDDAGQGLDSSDVSGIVIGNDGNEHELKISSRSCIVVDSSAREIRLKSTKNGHIISAFIATGTLDQTRLSRISLEKIPKLNIDFSCASQGVFGRERVSVGVSTEIEGKSENIAIKVLAKSTQSGIVYPIYEKKLGAAIGNLGSDINIEHLPLGIYDLQFAIHDFSIGLNDPFKILNTKNQCLLTKVDSMPILKGPDGRVVVKKGEALFVPHEDYSISFCKEKLLDSVSKGQCVPSGQCLHAESFQKARKIVADASGSFRYYYYYVDRVLQKSNLACGDYLVSETSPDLSIQWANPSYSSPGASLHKPLVRLPLKISTQHSNLNAVEISKNLRCSATFVIKNGIEIPAEMLTCSSKECSGQSLGKPVPCGSDLELDMRKVYGASELWDSILKIKVSADDGVGHVSEGEAGLWLNSSSWGIRDEGRLLNIDFSDSNHRSSNRFIKTEDEVQFLSSFSKLEGKINPGLAIRFLNGKTSIFESPEAGYRRATINGVTSAGNTFVSWSSGTCKLYKYDESMAFEEIKSPKYCGEDLVIFDEVKGNIYGSYGNGYGKPNAMFRFNGNSWEDFRELPSEFDDCPSRLKFAEKSASQFSVGCAEAGVSVSYDNGGQVFTGLLENLHPFVIPEDISSIPTDRGVSCDDNGALYKENSLYIPIRQLFRKIMDAVSGDFWIPELCVQLASSGESLLFYDGVTLRRLFYDHVVKLEQAHLPNDYLRYAKSDVELGHHLHPLVVTKNKTIKILKGYEWAEVKLPDSSPEFEDGMQLTVDHGGKLILSSRKGVFYSNNAQEWLDLRSNSKIVKPAWVKSDEASPVELPSPPANTKLGQWKTTNGLDLIFIPPDL